MAYRIESSFLEPRLFENTIEGPWRDVVVGLSCNSNAPRLGEVLKLSVTSFRSDKIPSVIMKRESRQRLKSTAAWSYERVVTHPSSVGGDDAHPRKSKRSRLIAQALPPDQ